MTKLTTQPTNDNFLSPLGFKFVIQKTPSTNYYVTQVNIPSVSLGETNLPTPFVQVPIGGDHLQYGELQLTFRVDEDMTNYIELYNWLSGLGFPEDFEQYRDELDTNRTPAKLYSDATLVVMNSNMRANKQIIFKDVFPTSVGDLQFDLAVQDLNYILCTAMFKYTTFEITNV